MSVFFGSLSRVLPLMAYIICFVFFYRRMKTGSNTISMGLLKVWGIVLIGSQLLVFLYMSLIPAGNSAAVNMLWRCRELIILLPIIIVLLVTGILTQRRAITLMTGLYSILFFVLFMGMQEVRWGMLGGYGTMVSGSSISIRLVLTVGMVVLGIFLKRGAGRNGNKFNTGSISD